MSEITWVGNSPSWEAVATFMQLTAGRKISQISATALLKAVGDPRMKSSLPRSVSKMPRHHREQWLNPIGL
jgi:hypothetical protein